MIRLASGTDRVALEILEKLIFNGDAECFLDDLCFVVDAGENGVVGSIFLSTSGNHRGTILSIGIIDEFRQQGHGTALLEAADDAFQKMGVRKMKLQVEITRFGAIVCYMKYGFVMTSLMKNYYGRGRHAYIMEKRIRK